MPLKIFLLRHGQAECTFGQSDFDRELTFSGVEQIKRLGQFIFRQKPILTELTAAKIVCSPSVRTRQTLEALMGELNLSDHEGEFVHEIYEASLDQLLKVIQKTECSFSRLFLIGHNPAISYLFDYLTDDHFGNLGPGHFVEVNVSIERWAQISRGLGSLETDFINSP